MGDNRPTTAPAPTSISDLTQQFGQRWTVAYDATLNVWSAEQRSPDGRHIRFLAAHAPGELANKLAGAELVEP